MASNSFSKLSLVYPAAGWLTALCDVSAIALIAAGLLRVRLAARFHTYIFGGSLAVIAMLSIMGSSAGSPLPSDEVGLTQAAAQALVDGHNPYTVDYLKADPDIAAQPSSWFTPTFSGKRVSELAYPAGTFLVLAPLVAVAGVGSLNATYALLLLATVAIAWLMVPQRIRPLVTVLLYLMTASGVLIGSTDAVYLPFVLLAIWRWPRFVSPGGGRLAAAIGPLALGVACSMKQNAWVLAPFLLLGVVLEARAQGRGWLRAGATYTGLALAGFLVVNLPFMVADWGAWFHAVALPFTLHTVILGNGVAAIPLAGAAGGDHLELLSLASAGVLAASFFFFALHYRRVRLILPLLPVIALTVSTRSLSGYLYFLLIPSLVGAVTLPALPDGPSLPVGWLRWLRIAAVAASVAAAGIVGYVLVQSPPLDLRVTSSQVSGPTWNGVEVSVTNHSDRTINPSFFAASTDAIDFTLDRASGPTSLAAGATETYQLRPARGDHLLKTGDVVRIVALADRPESISQSVLYRIGDASVGN